LSNKEDLDTFVRNLHKFPKAISDMVKNDWNKNTVLALSKATEYVPKKTGMLEGSGYTVTAKTGANGITSAFGFLMPYALDLEKGERDGKTITVRTDINRKAQTGYAKKGTEESAEYFIEDVKKAISRAFGGI